MDQVYRSVAKLIDHALLTPNLTQTHLESGLELALAYDVASVCILPYYVGTAADRLNGSTVRASTVIGFPHGGQTWNVKRDEAIDALGNGAEELDMVVNISQVLSGDWTYVRDEIAAVVNVTHDAGQKLKVIFENCYLQDEHKRRLCEICGELNVDWVKTSTGFGSSGATPEDVRLMRDASPAHVQVKAAGGIRDLATLECFRDLGATRIGTSRTAEILDELRQRLGLPAIRTAGVARGESPGSTAY